MILTKLGKAFFLLTIDMVESESPPIHEECCFEKMVGGVSYSLFHDVFHGSIPHQCLSGCVYTRSGTSSPKFCFQRGDLRAECLSEVPVGLVGGSGPWEGNVMIYGKPVCDDHWGQEDANVVCRQLGYLYGEPTERSYFGPVSSDFAFDDVQCRGDEEYIWRCPHETEDDCGSHEGAGVICSNEEPGSGSGAPVIELVGGSGPHEGNILIHGRPVCDDIATPENAQVVCRQLGYLGGYITTNSFFGRVSSDFIMDDVNCNGTEEYIWRCPHETEDNCAGSEGMGVVCSNEEPGSGSGSVSGGPPHCPANWTSINTECYKILIGDLNWFEAEAQCEGMDSHLVDFESKEEHEAVLEEALKMEGIAGNNVGLWIGMTDSAEEGTWVWTSGKPVTYTAWSSGEPNNDGGREAENCAWMYAYQPSGGRLPGQWNDGRCHSGGAYSGAICKRAAVAQL